MRVLAMVVAYAVTYRSPTGSPPGRHWVACQSHSSRLAIAWVRQACLATTCRTGPAERQLLICARSPLPFLRTCADVYVWICRCVEGVCWQLRIRRT